MKVPRQEGDCIEVAGVDPSDPLLRPYIGRRGTVVGVQVHEGENESIRYRKRAVEVEFEGGDRQWFWAKECTLVREQALAS